MLDSKSPLNGKDDESTVATNFPLVLVGSDVELGDQPGRRKDLFLDQSNVPVERVVQNSGLSHVHVESLCPDLGLDQTSKQYDNPDLGPILQKAQSTKGVHSTWSSPICSPCFDPVNRGVDSSFLGRDNVLPRECWLL
ncbi:hypothetical protein V6N11_010453 [Hibiscus sabdariffa]|uniref:Uncharacterized protein n=1 Tax=Hibiscus sabdariffa TaxID=183260 RepID=A0ABR2S5F8_9ROSI